MYPLELAREAGAVLSARTGIPVDIATVWAGAESGIDNNPYGFTDGSGHLYAFSTLDAGASAAGAWLMNPTSPYEAVRAAIATGDAAAIVAAVQASPWGPAGYYAESWPRVAAAYGIALPGGPPTVTTETIPAAEPVATVTMLPAGQTGRVSAGARRFAATAPYAEVSPETADSLQAFDAELVITDPVGTHGTFWRTSGTPPVLFVKAAVETAPASGLVAVPAPPLLPPNPPAQVLPYLVSAFVHNNPDLDPTLAAQIAQVMGQGGQSAQWLKGTLGLHMSKIIPGLVVMGPMELPIYETEPVPDGTVISNAGLGPAPDMGVTIQGAWYAPPEDGHVSTAIGYIFTPDGMTGIVTDVTPGTENVHVGPTGSTVGGSTPAVPSPVSTAGTVTVQAGETLDQVAARAGVDPTALYAANRGLLGSSPTVTAGQVLDLPTA